MDREFLVQLLESAISAGEGAESIADDIMIYHDNIAHEEKRHNDPFIRIHEFLFMKPKADVPQKDLQELSAKLIFEELLELVEAFDTATRKTVLVNFKSTLADEIRKANNVEFYNGYDRTAAFDAIVDILYVLANAAYFGNFSEKVMKGFNEIHNNNLIKVNYSQEEAYRVHNENPGSQIHKMLDGTYYVTNESGKILKAKDHPKPNLEKILHTI